MSLILAKLPKLNMEELYKQRKEVEDRWETEFQDTHEKFADDVVLGIGSQILDELKILIPNTYKKNINSENKLTKNISFDITQNSSAKKFIKLAQSGKELPPFKEWLETFVAEKNEEEPQFSGFGNKSSYKYFQNLMAIVGGLVEQKLGKELESIQSDSVNKDLEFTVKWYRKDEQAFSSPSDFRDNCLRIELWSKKETDIEIQPNTQNNSSVILQQRVKLKELQSARTRNNIIAAVAILIIGMLILKSGVIEIILPKHRTA